MIICEGDFFRQYPTPAARQGAALAAFSTGGLPREWSVAMIALADGETSNIWTTSRPGTSPCCGQYVGIESFYFKNALKQMTESDLQWMIDRGYIGGTADAPVPGGGIANPFTPQHSMLLLEYVLANEIDGALQMFAMGATARDLAFVGKLCGFPASLDETREQYLIGEPVQAARVSCEYLTPTNYFGDGKGCITAPLPNGDRARDIAWLTHHAGNPTIATELYDGTIPGTNRKAYSAVWQETQAMASQMPWKGG